jgi:hypothetical protein
MGKSFVSKGKNIHDAVNIALQFLHTDQNDVEIEIIENESKGLWGIGAKPAVVRVTMKCEQPLETDTAANSDLLFEMLEKLELESDPNGQGRRNTDSKPAVDDSDLIGKVWVRNGHIFCKEAPDTYPLVTPSKGMKLFINDELVEKTTVVSENFLIYVELQDEVKEPEWELRLSEDKMSVALKVVPGYRIQRRLKNMAPATHVQLEHEENKIPLIIETDPIMDKLKEMGVVYGIEYAEIAAACTAEQAGTFVIAKGSPPSPGKNGCFMPIHETEIKKGIKEREDGSVDFREIQEFPTVVPGQVLGNILPPVEGIYGTSVTNDQIPPPEVYPLIVQEGKGVSLVDEGMKIIATDAGHPEIVIKGQLAKISIIPKIVIGKDVNLETGNVHYAGAVDVHGSVQDGMCVEAEGDVTIGTNVNRAKVIAGGSIIVHRNIISSQVTAGNRNIMLAEISQLLAQIVEQMKKMAGAINQLSQVSSFKVSSFARTGLGPLIKILCDGKFKTFPPLMAAFIHKVKSSAEWLDADWIKLCADLHKGLIVVGSVEIKSVDDMLILIHRAEELIADSEVGPETECFVKAGIVHNSQVYSSGDVYVVGQGVYNSKLYAGGCIRVEGCVRGGEIYAEKGIYIDEAGTRGGIATKISVPTDETIRIKLALEDTIIQIGSRMYKFLEETPNVHGRLNEHGELKLH